MFDRALFCEATCGMQRRIAIIAPRQVASGPRRIATVAQTARLGFPLLTLSVWPDAASIMDELQQMDPDFAALAGMVAQEPGGAEPEAPREQQRQGGWRQRHPTLLAFARSRLETVRLQAKSEEALRKLGALQSRLPFAECCPTAWNVQRLPFGTKVVVVMGFLLGSAPHKFSIYWAGFDYMAPAAALYLKSLVTNQIRRGARHGRGTVLPCTKPSRAG